MISAFINAHADGFIVIATINILFLTVSKLQVDQGKFSKQQNSCLGIVWFLPPERADSSQRQESKLSISSG